MRSKVRGALAIAGLVLLLAFYGWQLWIVAVQPETQPNPHRTNSSAQQVVRPKPADERIADYTEILAIVTALLAIVSAVQIWFLLRADQTARISAESARSAVEAAQEQAGHLKASLEISSATAKATAISAEAARTSAQNVIDTERARLMVHIDRTNIADLLLAVRSSVQAISAGGTIQDFLWVDFKFRNYGRTPAIIMWVFRAIVIHTTIDEDRRQCTLFEPDDDAVVDGFAVSQSFQCKMGSLITIDTARDVIAGRRELKFVGTVRFKDIFRTEYDGAFSFTYDIGVNRMRLNAYTEETRQT